MDAGPDDIVYDADVNEGGTRLTVRVCVGHKTSTEEFAALLQDFIDDMKEGKISVEVMPDSDEH